jgi:CRP/FNR family transcriptional regulator
MSALKKDGVILIEANRHITIPDLANLLDETGDDADGGMLS